MLCTRTMQQLISIEKAHALIAGSVPAPGAGEANLDKALGTVLAEDILADRPIPPYDRVMMDGIAIAHASYADGRRDFRIAGTQAAGMPALELTDPATCIEVMTGAPLPRGADTVVMVEDISTRDGTAHLRPDAVVSKNQHIHPLGSDKKSGAPLVPSGSLLGAPELAIAASVGRTQLLVHPLPRILLVTTGDEVIPPDETPEPYQIRRSHYHAIRAGIESHRLGVVRTVHVPDDPEALEHAIRSGIGNHDAILLTGGISKGKFDHVAPVLRELAGEPLFHGVAQRPGKPFAFWLAETGRDSHDAPQHENKRARADDDDEGGEECKRARADDGAPTCRGEECKRAIFALPGNPVSVMACLARYVLPALRQMRGEPWKPGTLPLARDLVWNAPFPGLVACRISQNQIHPQPPRNSGDYTALAGSHGICEIASTTRAGTLLKFYPW